MIEIASREKQFLISVVMGRGLILGSSKKLGKYAVKMNVFVVRDERQNRRRGIHRLIEDFHIVKQEFGQCSVNIGHRTSCWGQRTSLGIERKKNEKTHEVISRG